MLQSSTHERSSRDALRAPWALSIRTHVALIALACILPLLAFSAFATFQFADAGRKAGDAQIAGTARALTAAIDFKLQRYFAALSAVAASPFFSDASSVAVYEQCEKVAREYDAWIVLADSGGHPILSTFGAPLPEVPLAEVARRALEMQSPQISNLFLEPSSHRFLVAAAVPAKREDKPYALLMGFAADKITQVLADQKLPENWTVAVVDRNGKIAARNRAPEQFVGRQATESLLAKMAEAPESRFVAINQEGTRVLTAISKSPLSGWTVAIGIPVADLDAPLNHLLRNTGLAAAAVLLLGVALASIVGARMGRSLRELSDDALALVRDVPLTLRHSRIKEVNAAITAHAAAANLLHQNSLRRDEAEASLRASEQRFRDIADVSGDWIWEMGPDLRFSYFVGDYGGRPYLNPNRIIGRTRWELAGADPGKDAFWARHKADLEARLPLRNFRYSMTTPWGKFYFSVSGKPLFGKDGEFLGYRGTAADQTEIVEARERTEQAEALLRDAVDSISEGFVIYDRDDCLVMCNQRYRDIYSETAELMQRGESFEAILRDGLAKHSYVEAIGREEEWLVERLRHHRAATGAVEQRLQSGRWLLITDRRMRSGGIAGLRVDITALKSTQAALRESEIRLDRAQRIAGIGSWELDVKRGRMIWSKEMYRLTGLSPEIYDLRQSELEDRVEAEDLGRVGAWLEELKAGRAVTGIQFGMRLPSGEQRYVGAEGEPIVGDGGVVLKVSGTLRDLTAIQRAEQARRELERQLSESQKMEALGTLAGGIAHDLNNALVPVIALSLMMMEEMAEDDPRHGDIERILKAGRRARDLVQKILSFSRRERPESRLFELTTVVDEAAGMLRATLPSTIRFEAETQGRLMIYGDPGQIHQVLVNLVTNAAQAIGGGQGVIRITSRPSPSAPASTAELSVTDTGCGMDEATLSRIFEPFFTTKKVGEGTGLGLAIVHGIVTSHKGALDVRSRPGEGTVFTIRLPLAKERDNDRPV